MIMMKKSRRVLISILAVGMILRGIPAYAESNGRPGGMRTEGNGMGNGPMGNMGASDMQDDPSIQAVLDENASKFEQFSYTDSELGITLEYSLYIPQGYDESTEYPLIMFIPDSTGAGLSSQEIVENYYGAAVWASDEDQEKHPSFVLVPAYTGTVTDDNWNASSQLDATVSLIHYLVQEYSIDENRLYTTGQSMGCMSSLYLNSTYPDLFAASLYVSGQWDISVLSVLEDQKFFYIEPTGEKGVVSLGGFFGAMDISGELGRATAGYATPGFAIEARLGLGQIKTETKGADIKETVEGDDWGLTLSKTLGGYVVTLSGDWITFAKETNVDPVRGPKTEQRYRDLDASLIVTDGPSARKHFWSAGVAFNRHEDELESGGTLIGDSLTSNFTVVPLFNYGTPVLRANYANVYMGLNASVPVTVYDKADMRDSTSGKYKEASLWTVGVNLAPNILGEVLLTESLMLFGEASYTWEAFRYVDNQTPYADVKVKRSVADKVEATMGLRYQYKDWAACEFAFGDSFFTDTKSIFNGEGVFVSFGGFIYF